MRKRKLLTVLLSLILASVILLCLASCSGKVIYLDDLRSLDGVIMTTEKAVYPHGTAEVKVAWENNTARTLTFGESYYLARKENGNWQKLPVPGGIAFNDIGYIVLPFGKATHTYRLDNIYKNLKAGEYRVVTHFFDNADIPVTSDDAYWLYAEFMLSSDS